MGFYALFRIFHMKYLNAFPHVPLSSIISIPYCELFYAIMSLIKVINLTSHFYFQWSSSQEECGRAIQAGLLNPTSDIKKAMAEAEATAKCSYQHNISIQIQLPKICYSNFNELLLNFHHPIHTMVYIWFTMV